MRYVASSILLVAIGIAANVVESHHGQNPLTTYGTPTADFRQLGGYLVSFDGRTRTPRWVLERIDRKKLAGDAERGDSSFHLDRDVPAEFRPTQADYEKSGFDIGHMAAAADFGKQLEMNATFVFTNAAPQVPALNRGPWKSLEKHLRDVAASESCKAVFVVTAPIYAGDRDAVTVTTIGPHAVWAPTHCGKSALFVHADGTLELHSWVLPNAANVAADFNHYLVTTDEFETVAGIDVFAAMPDKTETKLEAQK